jgi:hypothetical protein
MKASRSLSGDHYLQRNISQNHTLSTASGDALSRSMKLKSKKRYQRLGIVEVDLIFSFERKYGIWTESEKEYSNIVLHRVSPPVELLFGWIR